ncbi:MAG: FHA domain-containing protein [Deltaproteobacteria bacterium]|nr:FHA domain-containing protein [Deltaproteobacteria bacterium]
MEEEATRRLSSSPPGTGPGSTSETSLVVEERSGQEMRFVTTLRIGRHPGNDLVVTDDQVSGHHAVIEPQRGRWVVRDLGSLNGTSVNGRRIKGWKALHPGDVLRFAGGAAWRIARLAPHPDPKGAQALPTAGNEDPDIADLEVVLAWSGPADGVVHVSQGEVEASVPAGLPFVLLDLLAHEPGAWHDDSGLKTALWGRQANRLSRSAFHVLIHETRDLLAALGVPRGILEKRFGRTRLGLDPGQVRREPAS